MIPLLEKLKVQVGLLNSLLCDPHPGLMSWNMAVGERWKAIAELWGDLPTRPVGKFTTLEEK